MTSSKYIFWLGGGWHDRKEYVLKDVILKKQQIGYQIITWDKDFEVETSGQVDFFAPPRVVVVPPKTRIGKKQLDALVAVANDELMLLICETAGVPSTATISASNAVIHNFPEPKPWEVSGKYGEIFKDILKKKYSKEISLDLATELAKRIGLDFAFLDKEALKYSTLPQATLDLQAIAGVVTVSPQFDAKALMDALKALDAKAFLRACMRIESYSTTDQTMPLCKGILSPTVIKWIEAHAMLKARHSVEAVCEALDIKFKSTFEKEIPLLNKLGEEGLIELISLVSDCEKAVEVLGVGEPFLKLKYGLLSIILKYSKKGNEE